MGLRINNSDYKKLSAGFEPHDQEYKWRVSVFDQNQSQSDKIISIHVIRVVANREIHVLFVDLNNGGSGGSGGSSSSSSGGGGGGGGGGVVIEAITWEQNKGGIRVSEEQAKKEVLLITRSMLQCDYDALPDMFNHPGARIRAE